MYQTVTFSDFVDAFHEMDRFGQFAVYYTNGEPVGAYEGLRALFDYIEEFEDGSGVPQELDVIALCCDFAHDTASEIADQWGIPPQPDDMTDEEFQDSIEEELRNRGVYVATTGYGFVYLQH